MKLKKLKKCGGSNKITFIQACCRYYVRSPA